MAQWNGGVIHFKVRVCFGVQPGYPSEGSVFCTGQLKRVEFCSLVPMAHNMTLSVGCIQESLSRLPRKSKHVSL